MKKSDYFFIAIISYIAHKAFENYSYYLPNTLSNINNNLGLYNASTSATEVVIGSTINPYIRANNPQPHKKALDIATSAFLGALVTFSIDNILIKQDSPSVSDRLKDFIYDNFWISVELFTKLFLSITLAESSIKKNQLKKSMMLFAIGSGVDITKQFISMQETDYTKIDSINAVLSGIKLPLYFIETQYEFLQTYLIEKFVGVSSHVLHNNSVYDIFHNASDYILGFFDDNNQTQDL